MSISEQTKTSTLNNTRKNYTYKVSIIALLFIQQSIFKKIK
jgi:hypothetical protein